MWNIFFQQLVGQTTYNIMATVSGVGGSTSIHMLATVSGTGNSGCRCPMDHTVIYQSIKLLSRQLRAERSYGKAQTRTQLIGDSPLLPRLVNVDRPPSRQTSGTQRFRGSFLP